jgi:competence protein ComEC
MWLSIAFVCGIILGSLLSLEIWIGVGLVGLFLFLAIIEQRINPRLSQLKRIRRAARLPFGVLLVAFSLGAVRLALTQPEWTPSDLAWYNDLGTVRMVGVVVSDPDRRENGELLRLRVTQISPMVGSDWGEPVEAVGDAIVRLAPEAGWQYGDQLDVIGHPLTPSEHEDFSYRDYLARQGIHTYITRPSVQLLERDAGRPVMAVIYNLRRRAYTLIQEIFPMPESALLGGILLGIESDLPDPLLMDFRDTGTTHIIAISGFNIAILAALFSFFFVRVFRRWWVSLLATMICIVGYTILVGADPPVVRAAIMGGMGLFGRHIGRRQTGVNSLSFTAALMCLFNPLLLWDAGFQLSFMATLGLVKFADPLLDGFSQIAGRCLSEINVNRLTGPVGEYFLFTIAAQLTTLPVIAYHFQRISLSSFIVNLLILPAQPLVMILGGLSVLLGLVVQPLGQLMAYLAWGPLAYTIRVVETFAGLWRGVIILGDVSLWGIGLYYAALFFFPRMRIGWQNLSRGRIFLAGVTCLLLSAGFLWRAALALPDGRLHLMVLDVPDGPAYLLQTPGGEFVLINGSSSASQLGSNVQRWLPPFRHHLDYQLFTNRDASSLQGLSVVLERFPPLGVLWSRDLPNSNARTRLLDTLQRQGTPVTLLKSGHALDLGNGAELSIMVENSEGTALLISWEGFRVLIPGGISPYTLQEEVAGSLFYLSAIVLSEEDTQGERSSEWTHLIPACLLWAGSGPLPVEGISTNQVSLVDHGWIRGSTDGANFWVETQR